MANMNVTVNSVWKDGVKGNGALKAGNLDTDIAIPLSLGGSGNGANPKELLIASVTTCYVATLTYMLEKRKLPVVELKVNSEANIKENEIEVIHFPEIALSASATEAQVQSAQRAMAAADVGCEVGNLLKKAGVTIEIQGKVATT